MSGSAAREADGSRALWLATTAHTACFAVWTIFSIIGLRIAPELGLTETGFGLLVAIPILVGSLARIPLAILAEWYGARRIFAAVMVVGAAATYLLSLTRTYPQMLAVGLVMGVVGGSFTVGISFVAQWYSTEQRSRALDFFGAGIIGAAVTHLVAPVVVVAYDWRTVAQSWAIGLLFMAGLVWFAARDAPGFFARKSTAREAAFKPAQLVPLKNIQVWRFSLYYFSVFGAFVALALWLPRYIMEVYRLDIQTAAIIAAAFSVSAALCRIYGASVVRDYGARRTLYWTFSLAIICAFILSYPPTDYVSEGISGPITYRLELGVVGFAALVLVLGSFLAFGQVAVFEHIPAYYPDHVTVVAGVVGMVGGLGGFVLPIAFGILADLTDVRQTAFMLLFGLVSAALIWMHFAIRYMERTRARATLSKLPELPEMEEIHHSAS